MAQATTKKDRIPLQTAGQPSGKHLTGFKGSKSDEECFCGKCNPAAKANHNRPIWYVFGKRVKRR